MRHASSIVLFLALGGCYDLGSLPGYVDLGVDAGLRSDGGPPADGSAWTRLDVLSGKPGGGGAAEGQGSAAFLEAPAHMCLDSVGNIYFTDSHVPDRNAALVGKVAIADGTLSIVAGLPFVTGETDGPGAGPTASATFVSPAGCVVDPHDAYLYVADSGAAAVRRIDLLAPTRDVHTVVGVLGHAGTASEGRLGYPDGLWLDPTGSELFIADRANNDVIVVDLQTSSLESIAGSGSMVAGYEDGPGSLALFDEPTGLATDGKGTLLVADTNNHVVRTVDIGDDSFQVSTLAGMQFEAPTIEPITDGSFSMAVFGDLESLAYSSAVLWGVDYGNASLRGMSFASASVESYPVGVAPVALLVAPGDTALYVGDRGAHQILDVALTTASVPVTPGTTIVGTTEHPGDTSGTAAATTYDQPVGVYYDPADGKLYVTEIANAVVREVGPDGSSTIIAGTPQAVGNGDGPALMATFNTPIGIAADAANNLYVTDQGTNDVRVIDAARSTVTLLAGNSGGAAGFADGPGKAALFSLPSALAVVGTTLYVADSGNDVIRTIDLADPQHAVATLAPTGLSTLVGCTGLGLHGPFGLAADAVHRELWVSNPGGCSIVAIDLAGNSARVLSGAARGVNVGTPASFIAPQGLAFDGAHTLYAADALSGLVTAIETTTGASSLVAGQAYRHGVAAGPLPGRLNRPVGVAYWPGSGLVVTVPFENALLVVH